MPEILLCILFLHGVENCLTYGRVAQLGEHRPYKPRVTGSSPVPPITYGGVAQLWLERWPVKPEVAGSSPVTPAMFNFYFIIKKIL